MPLDWSSIAPLSFHSCEASAASSCIDIDVCPFLGCFARLLDPSHHLRFIQGHRFECGTPDILYSEYFGVTALISSSIEKVKGISLVTGSQLSDQQQIHTVTHSY